MKWYNRELGWRENSKLASLVMISFLIAANVVILLGIAWIIWFM